MSGSCEFRPHSPVKGAAVAAFVRGNVAVLIEVSSRSNSGHRPSHHRAGGPPAVRRPSHRAESPSRAVVSTSNGSCSGSASSPPWHFAHRERASADEGAGGDPSWPSPRRSVGARSPSGCPSLAVVGAMAFSMLDSTIMRGFGEWFGVATFGDFWQNWADAAYMTFAGGYGHIYVLDRTLETAPALQVITAPIARLAFRPLVSLPERGPLPDGVLGGGAAVPGWHGPAHLCLRPVAQRHGGHRYPSSPHRSRRDGDHAASDPLERASRGPDRPGGDALRDRRGLRRPPAGHRLVAGGRPRLPALRLLGHTDRLHLPQTPAMAHRTRSHRRRCRWPSSSSPWSPIRA